MRAVLQRVKEAHVTIDGETVGAISQGLLVFLGVTHLDTQKEADYLADRIAHIRIFADDEGRMNRSVLDTGGAFLVVSQFTLYGNSKKGRRPSFIEAARPEQARQLYDYFIQRLRVSNRPVETGVFQADMQVHIVNDGPVTLLLDTAGNLET
jgi:D-aminoacyl-tRNA deacylase